MAEAVPGLHPGLRVERLTEDTWRDYRAVRLAALIDSPRAFWTTYAEAAARSDDDWRAYAASGPATWLAWDLDRPVGTAGLWHGGDQPGHEACLVGMWVSGGSRGSGIAADLVDAAVAHAQAEGRTRVVLDVARENARALRFYLRRGFVLTGETGVMPWDPTCVEERMALDLT
ncbi:MAG: GNAT family N-acetyltransferase [Micrococcales bacterium]|nr:GNAT family N-acetyltransferase [Micrococcales bacterium]